MPSEGTLTDHEDARTPEQIVADMRAAVTSGTHWFLALLEAVAAWRVPEEHAHGRRYRYLIGGEAFDWLVLAERLCAELEEWAPEDEREALLFSGRLPLAMTEDEFREALGPAKYRAHLNYLYGVTVEEALLLSVEEEVHKESRGQVWQRHSRPDEVAHERVYGRPKSDLLAQFLAERALPPEDALSFTDWKEFTYWLFKYRVRACDPARVASDTRRGLAQLSRLEALHKRSPVFVARPAADVIDV